MMNDQFPVKLYTQARFNAISAAQFLDIESPYPHLE